MIRFNENNEIISSDHPRAVLVAASKGQESPELLEWRTGELSGLAEAAGAEVIGVLTQNVESINAATYIGSGKLEELSDMCSNMDAELVIFDGELSGMQLRNIENACGVKVIDRTILILDIFADRASSAEGKLQVEMAQLQYRMPRLLGFGRSLSRQGGGIGTRGPGEKKLETDRRLIRDRISELNNELDNVVRTRDVTRAQRIKANIPGVAIVGYTNAGKSTLLNTATGSSELEADKLFATLDPVVRELVLENGQKVLMTDTVGFVRKLPHHLVDAFRSTLEEAKYSDIILQTVDASDPDHEAQTEVTYETLDRLGIKGKTFITFFNKMDRLADRDESLKDLRADYVIRGSAKTGEGLDELKAVLDKIIKEKRNYIEKVFAFTEAGEIQKIRRNGQIISEEYMEDGIHIKAYVDRKE